MFRRRVESPYHRLTRKEKKVRAYTALVDLLDTALWIRGRLGEQLRWAGLKLSDFRLLELLHREGPTSLPAAARKLQYMKSSLRIMLQQLVERGWARHQPPAIPASRGKGRRMAKSKHGREHGGHRAGILSLTPQGEKFIGMIFPRYSQVVKSLMHSLDAREQESLSRLCRKLRVGDARKLVSELTCADVDDQET